QGVDLWLNNPRRPHEASGTSGMKVIPNAGLNLSILDGWWDEAYQPGLGWAIGDREDDDPDEGRQDWLDSRSIYHLLENEITPAFYHRTEQGIPREWTAMVKRSIAGMASNFSTNRMVRDYTKRFYMPAAEAFTNLSSNGMERAKAALAWRDSVRLNWGQLRILSVTDTAGVSNVLGKEFDVRVVAHLGSLKPEEVRVQAVVGKVGPNRDLVSTRIQDLQPVGQEDGNSVFAGHIVCDVPGYQGYTIRVIPHHEDVHVPSELSLVLWE
ncbi:MAG TPA: hypothetical protein VGE01_10745, partial [Fimbriimonas sp.]